MRRLFAVMCSILISVSSCFAKDVKIHGFVTSISSPTSFEIDDYKITRDLTLVLDIEKDDDGVATAVFKPDDIRIGTELEIKGDLNDSTGELKAKSIKVFLEDTRKIKRTALLHRVPNLEKTPSGGWKGMIFTDGQKVTVSDTVPVMLKLNRGERKLAKADKSTKDQPEVVKLASLEALNLDTYVHYEGFRQADGTVLASKVEFQHGELEEGEAKMWKSLSPKVKESDFLSFKPGELKISRSKYKLVPSKEAQDYISTLGASLIPPRQKELATGDPLKIPFRFYLVENRSFNASAYPNGVVIVHSGVFDVAENEAQLAFILSHEITHAVEKHTWRQQQYHKKALMALRIGGAIGAGFGGQGIADLANMIEGGIRNGYSRSLENQSDREGMEMMLWSGYDIREAPRAWKAVSMKYGDAPTNFFWDSHDNNTTRRSYLMSEIRNNYPDVDYSSLKKDSEDFHRIGSLVREAAQGKKKVKVKVAK